MADRLGGGARPAANPMQPAKPESIRVSIPVSMFAGAGAPSPPPVDTSRIQGSPDAARMLAQLAMQRMGGMR